MLLSASSMASAQLLDFSWDNDILFGTDGSYTNGVKLGWRGDEERVNRCPQCWSSLLANTLDGLPGIGGSTTMHSLGAEVRQVMGTPQDISITTPQYDDTPYVGILRGDISLFSRQANSATSYSLSFGAIGPNSGAESTQKSVHKLTGSTKPQGWDTQLDGEALFGIGAARADRIKLWAHNEGRQTEWGTAYGAQLNNFLSYAAAGTFVRYGHNLPSNLLPDYAGIGSSVSLPGLLANRNYGWSLFAGVAAEAVGYSYLEEEAEGYQYDKDPFVGYVTLGASAHTPDFHISLSLRQTSSQTRNARRTLQFGTLALIWAF